MYGNGNSVFCNNQLTLHPHSLVMSVDKFLYLPKEQSLCFEISEYNNKKYVYRTKNDVKDFEIKLKTSNLFLVLMGIGKDSYSFLSSGSPSSFCDSESFLKKTFLAHNNGQYVCVQTFLANPMNTTTDSVMYYDQLRFDATLVNGKKIMYHSQSVQENNGNIKEFEMSQFITNKTLEIITERVLVLYILFHQFFK